MPKSRNYKEKYEDDETKPKSKKSIPIALTVIAGIVLIIACVLMFKVIKVLFKKDPCYVYEGKIGCESTKRCRWLGDGIDLCIEPDE